MKIKKFEAGTQQEAIEKVREELGADALILNITETRPKGILSFARKTIVEVTAAYEDRPLVPKPEKTEKSEAAEVRQVVKESSDSPTIVPLNSDIIEAGIKDAKINEQKEKIDKLEKKLVITEEMLRTADEQLQTAMSQIGTGRPVFKNAIMHVFYDSMVSQDVLGDIAHEVLSEIDKNITNKEKNDINLLVKIVYNKLISIIGAPKPINVSDIGASQSKVVVFIGSTGVGKTTTIAKLTAGMIIDYHLSVGLITSDTYRIAAIEQLKTYADILGIDVGVSYSAEDMEMHVKNMSSINDLIFIDTAGRSHKNTENMDELRSMLSAIPSYQSYLVLSLTTKMDDILGIASAYSRLTDFDLILTKLDETSKLGSIFNICYKTGKRISYVTTGQNVPEDISVVSPENIIKALLGLGASE